MKAKRRGRRPSPGEMDRDTADQPQSRPADRARPRQRFKAPQPKGGKQRIRGHVPARVGGSHTASTKPIAQGYGRDPAAAMRGVWRRGRGPAPGRWRGGPVMGKHAKPRDIPAREARGDRGVTDRAGSILRALGCIGTGVFRRSAP